MAVLTIQDLEQFSKGVELDIPHWTDPDSSVTVLVRPVDISKELLDEKSLFSQLLKPEVLEKFKNKKIEDIESEENTEDNLKTMKDMLPQIDKIVENILIQPTYQDFKKLMPLTFEQKIHLFAWASEGVNKLKKNN